MRSDQPNQRSEHCSESKEHKRNGKDRSRDRSTDEPLLGFTGLTGLGVLELRLHLRNLIVHHFFGSPPFVGVVGIRRKLTRLSELLAQRHHLRFIGAESSGILKGFATLLKIAQSGDVTCSAIEGQGYSNNHSESQQG